MDRQARCRDHSLVGRDKQQDCTVVGMDFERIQHTLPDCSHQIAAEVEVEVAVNSFEDYMPAAGATQRTIHQTSCCAATGIRPDTHIHLVAAVPHHLLLPDAECCMLPDQDSHTAAALLLVVVHTVRSVLTDCMDPGIRVAEAAAADTGHFDSMTCRANGHSVRDRVAGDPGDVLFGLMHCCKPACRCNERAGYT